MCGIGGVISSNIILQSDIDKTKTMLEHLVNRGPDSNGLLSKNKVCIAHTRLAIQDVSDNASQPMQSKCGRYVIVFNGEIYNFQNLKEHYPKEILWSSTSDTEVLLQLLIDFEPLEVIKKIEGMYVFCFIDLIDQVAVLARDKFGQKPLYYWKSNDRFVFSSSFTAIKNMVSGYSKQIISEDSVNMYLGTGFIHQPRTICTEIFQLNKESIVNVDFEASISLVKHFISEKPSRINLPSTLQDVITESVEKCLVSDVPLGCFLSGGIDSSIIAALARKFSPVKSYCLGFRNKSYDESIYAEKIAKRIDTDHETYYLSDDEIIDIASKIPEIFGEPFADPSLIPLVALSRYAKKDIKVALTGDGGDELFYGYNRYALLNRISFIRSSKLLSTLVKKCNKYRYQLEPIGNIFRINALPDKLEKLNSFVDNESIHNYWDFFSTGFYSYRDSNQVWKSHLCPDLVRELDINYYQLSNTLVKSDRSSMYSGIELRAPMLEKAVSEYVDAYVSSRSEIFGFKGKRSLRDLSYNLVGEDLLNRQKAGFTPPLVEWLEGPLSSWANQGLSIFYHSDFGRRLDNLDDSIDNSYLYSLQKWRYAIMGHWLRYHDYA